MNELILRRNDLKKIIQHCQEEKANEACGILAGIRSGEKAITEMVYCMENTEQSPERYFMNPEEQFTVLKEIRSRNHVLLATFHSHPETPAVPSKHDLKMAYMPDSAYMIISLVEEEPEIKVYNIRDGKHSLLKVTII